MILAIYAGYLPVVCLWHKKSEKKIALTLRTVFYSVQVHWAQQDGSAIRHQKTQTAVRSCAVDEVTTPQELSKSPSANANSDGAVLWSAWTVKSPWTCTRARPPIPLIRRTRPEDMPSVPPALQPHPFPLCRTSCGTWHSAKVCPKMLCVSALPCPHLSSSFAWLFYLSP